MNEKYRPKIEINNSFKQELKNVIEWSEDNTQGTHNFLRIVTDALSPELLELIRSNGYKIVYFNDISELKEQEALEKMLISSQGVKELKENKVAMIVSKKVREQVGAKKQLQDTWRIHSQYLSSFNED